MRLTLNAPEGWNLDDYPCHEFADYKGNVQDSCDYLVIGSGPGGALVAQELIKTGKKVIVVEAGPKIRREEFHDDAGRVLADWFMEGGTRTTMGNVAMPTLQGRALGGGSVFNSAICLRATPLSLDKWADEHGVEGLSPEQLAPHYEAVESFMGVRPVKPEVQGRRNELFAEGCENLGWTATPIERNEEGCVGSGGCIQGCRAGAKLSTDRRGIREFALQGGIVYTSVQADTLMVRDGRVVGMEGSVVDPKTKRAVHTARIHARCTILAAGAIGSPVLARNSGLTGAPIGANFQAHPSGFHMGFFGEKVRPWNGATQGMHCLDFLDEGIKIESLWASSAVLAIRMPGSGRRLKRYLAKYDQIATWAVWISGDDSTGSVRALPGGRAQVSFNLGPGDTRRLQEANAKLAELFFAAGAESVMTGLRGIPPELRDAGEVDLIRRAKMEPKDFPTGSNHIFGGMCMGADPERHATDSWGKVYGVDDLYVADTGLFPSSPGVNPMLTAMALAHRLGRELPRRY